MPFILCYSHTKFFLRDAKMLPTQSSQEQHIALLAFPFGSHDRTLLGLACKLARAAPGVRFSFLSTLKSNESLFSASKPKLPHNIIPYNVENGIPKNRVLSKNTLEEVDLFLKLAPKSFEKALELTFLQSGTKISFLITDVFLSYFAANMAKAMQVPWVALFVAVPHNLSAHLHTHLIRNFYNQKLIQSEETLEFIPGLSIIRVNDLSKEILPLDYKESFFACAISNLEDLLPQADAIVMNFYQELYSAPLLQDLKSKFSKLLNVGFLTQDLPPLDSKEIEYDCLSWLDKQKPQSVVYISFGITGIPPPNELMALAEALEESHFPFIWSLKEDEVQHLPSGFAQRTSLVGKIISWAPQKEVLGHTSIGVFVNHCGANSMFESIANGVPIICRPLFADHMMNGRIVEEIWGIGMKVEGLVFEKNKVLRSLEMALRQEEGMKMRARVLALRETVLKAASPKGSADQDFKSLLAMMLMA